jgi:hypothetical protein
MPEEETTMALVFYKPENKTQVSDFKNCMSPAQAWNDVNAVGIDNDVSRYATQRNNEADIKAMLESSASRFAMSEIVYDNPGMKTKVTLGQAVANSGDTVVVLKGIHQKSKPHVTVAYGMHIFHLYVQELGSDQTKFGVKSMSKGEAYDQLGWKTV